MRLLAVLLCCTAIAFCDVSNCSCDPASAESLAKRECSLCREAAKQPAGTVVFYLKDINPNKPNRWLALPGSHAKAFADLTPEQRLAFWTGALAKAKELWGDSWGLAFNSDTRRSQCHLHVHIGKLSDDAEDPDFTLVNGPAEIPLPKNGGGMLIHPVNGKLHVHMGDEAPEMLLLR